MTEQVDPANVLPGQHPPVPQTKDELLIEALRSSNRVGGLLNEIAAWLHDYNPIEWGSAPDEPLDKLDDILSRRFTDCSGVHLFIAASNIGIDLPPDLDWKCPAQYLSPNKVDDMSSFPLPAMPKLKVGDVVQLKSGGPRMTVTRLDVHPLDERIVGCSWFADGGKQQYFDISTDALKPAESKLKE